MSLAVLNNPKIYMLLMMAIDSAINHFFTDIEGKTDEELDAMIEANSEEIDRLMEAMRKQ